jgi:hypothetical protein
LSTIDPSINSLGLKPVLPGVKAASGCLSCGTAIKFALAHKSPGPNSEPVLRKIANFQNIFEKTLLTNATKIDDGETEFDRSV